MDSILDSKLLPALVSAVIAIFIFFVSQWFLSKRNSIELMTKKLEELYLVVNELSTAHAIRYEKIRTIVNGDRAYLNDPEHIVKLYLHDLNKKIIMYIRLYFPSLAETHQVFFRENGEVSSQMHNLIHNEDGDFEAFKKNFIGLGEHIKALEAEIVENKEVLVGENIFPIIFKRK